MSTFFGSVSVTITPPIGAFSPVWTRSRVAMLSSWRELGVGVGVALGLGVGVGTTFTVRVNDVSAASPQLSVARIVIV